MKLILATALTFFSCASMTMAQVRNGLPPTSTDSFVRQAAGNAENIYGDEGHEGPPPFMYFEYENRINSGIYDIRDKGLTTGHGSYMPSAWGRDEFLGAEWSQSGANGGNPRLGGLGTTQDQNGNPQNGKATPATLPYAIGNGWLAVQDLHGNILGYLAPGESYQQFFSGESGHLLPGFQDETPALLAQVMKKGTGAFTTKAVSPQAIAQNKAAIAAAKAQAIAQAKADAAEAQAIAQAGQQSLNTTPPLDPSATSTTGSDQPAPTSSAPSDSSSSDGSDN